MTPELIACYLDVLKAARVKAACIKAPDGAEFRVDFEPEMPVWPEEVAADPAPGGWKQP